MISEGNMVLYQGLNYLCNALVKCLDSFWACLGILSELELEDNGLIRLASDILG